MYPKEKIFNDFYQGLDLLIAFETGQTEGAMNLPFYAINKVIACFNKAMEHGHTIAPFFLYYLADKFPEYLDKSLLPNLATVPCHLSKAQIWVSDYQTFLGLYEQVDKLIEQKEKNAVNQENLEKKLLKLEKKIALLMGSNSPLRGVLAAKIWQHIQNQTKNNQLTQKIIIAYEKSAFFPNIYAMHEYAQFLGDSNRQASTLEGQLKLKHELSLLAEGSGSINTLIDYYKKQKNDRFMLQWLTKAAVYGEARGVQFVIRSYIFDGTMQYSDMISDECRLEEGRRWFDWYEAYGSANDFNTVAQNIIAYAANFEKVIDNNKYRASFLCYALDKLNQTHHLKLPRDLLNFSEIIKLTWRLNNGEFPLGSSIVLISEMAILLEQQKEYAKAESLYRQAYEMDNSNIVCQYNLATILILQNKSTEEPINLYLCAASEGCTASIMGLFELIVVNQAGSIEDLKALRKIIKQPNFETELLPVPIELLIMFTSIAKLQYLTNVKMIEWCIKELGERKLFNAKFIHHEKMPSFNSGETVPHDSTESIAQEKTTVDDKNQSIEVTPKDKPKVNNNKCKLFQPPKNEANQRDIKRKRAFEKLDILNNKSVKNLTLQDLIEAQKAYQILMGDSAGIVFSRKGKTSGSRVQIGEKNVHLPHGRDRMSIGAKSEIKTKIAAIYQETKSQRP
ncbi:MAG TPA: hypothetical protein DCG13_00095 [Legionellales bacterium]|nr:hypothetical protein [Legionellales bacterium]HCA90260.1 hypothetical protein [Legionellales bacterium]|tara:strand:+ start:2717 stop:4750 length:2034 start_codon:yes stop_codon:yes gene_type:complete